MPVNLHHLLSALAVAENGSVSHAARAMHVSQPALSRTVRELEGQIGLPVFIRGPRGVEPTRAGREILRHARSVRAELERVERTAAAYRSAGAPRVRLGLSRVTPDRVLARALRDVIGRHPDLRIDVIGGAGPELLQQLGAGEIDLMFVVLPRTMATPERSPDEFSVEPLYTDESVVIARRGHHLSRRKRVPPEDLSNERFILWPEDSLGRRESEETFRMNGLLLPRAALVSDSVLFHLQMVAESDLLSVLPRAVAQADIDDRRLAVPRVDWKADRRQAVLVSRRNAAFSEACETIRAAIRESCLGLDAPRRHA
jgi:DNA-binding transcriptional LysR family regulator